ncbi:MAG: hypothetical protein B0A82_22310 [Alkalinema sp. CACIAM 70d]|nr:MAG: hypothetical protein B0A82_22310 [Alkalinema sp. CACIAM 70d]
MRFGMLILAKVFRVAAEAMQLFTLSGVGVATLGGRGLKGWFYVGSFDGLWSKGFGDFFGGSIGVWEGILAEVRKWGLKVRWRLGLMEVPSPLAGEPN